MLLDEAQHGPRYTQSWTINKLINATTQINNVIQELTINLSQEPPSPQVSFDNF